MPANGAAPTLGGRHDAGRGRVAPTSTVRSDDGTVIAYHSVGHGPGLVVVGGVLSAGHDYMALAGALAGEFEVHVMERRGGPGSGPPNVASSAATDEGRSLAW